MNFKKIILFNAILLGVTLSSDAQYVKGIDYKVPSVKAELELIGQLPGLIEGEVVSLSRFQFDEPPQFIDSVKVTNGRFIFNYRIENGPQVFFIHFSKHAPFISLALGNEKVLLSSTISLDAVKSANNFIDYLTVDGSPTFTDYIYIMLGIGRTWTYANQFINGNMTNFRDSVLSKDKLEFVSALLKSKQAVANAAFSSLVIAPVRDIIPILYRNNLENQHSSIWPYLYKELSEQAKNSVYGKWMSVRMPLCVKQQAPDFKFATKDKTEISLNDIVRKNNLTILHFWANQSVERVRIHGELVKAYSKYKSKGLEVVSVSLDANPEKWKRVIQEDKIPGYQFCDFKEEEGPIALLYKMDPKSTVNILIDQTGKIVAWDVDGPVLFGNLFNYFGE